MSTDTQSAGQAFDLWAKHERYRWMAALPRIAWGWELLRRDPHYRSSYRSARSSPEGKESANWSLVRFEDPDLDARSANVLWRRDNCRHVLPLAAIPELFKNGGRRFSLDGLQCRVTIHCESAGDRCHILFAQDGHFLQLEICGATHLEDGVLMTPVLPAPGLRDARLLAVRRLADLMAHGHLRSSLYPRYHRGPRLTKVVQALDGIQAGATYRDIALAFFGPARVERDWHYPNNYLRDHVRRTVDYGRRLMNGGYRRLLS